MLFSPAYLVDLFRQGRWGTIWRDTAEFPRYGLGTASGWRFQLLLDVLRHHTPGRLVRPLKWLRRRLPGVVRPKPWFSAPFRRLGLRDANRPVALGLDFHSAHARSVYLEARSKYHVHCLEVNNKGAAAFGLDSAYPFLDRDLIAFLMAAPGDAQCHGGVPRVLLREAMRGVLPEPVRARTWKADFTDVTNQGVARDMAEITRRLSGDLHAARAGILDVARLAVEVPRLAAGLAGPNADESWELADLFGLETWAGVFLKADRDTAGCSAVPVS
jgi:asparagine synthase (glutamine-hydrolysing)